MSWQVPRMWEGGDVWIIGGGPSIPKQFGVPDEIIKKVIEGSLPASVYSPYMKYLHDKHVIGVNAAFLLGNWIDLIFFGDSGFYLTYQRRLAAFPGLRVTCVSKSSEGHSWIKLLPRDGNHASGITDNPGMISWNGNSGAASISIAANAGAKRILLLGFDMKLGEFSNQHWHDLYGRGKITEQARLKKLPFHRFVMCFRHIERDAKRRGIEIINVCPDSMIKEFKKVSLKELIG